MTRALSFVLLLLCISESQCAQRPVSSILLASATKPSTVTPGTKLQAAIGTKPVSTASVAAYPATTSASNAAVDAAAGSRCALAIGTWCQDYHQQQPLPHKPAPRGSTPCPSNCSGIGVCHYGTGTCYCPAGRDGADCSQADKRPCSNMGPDRKDRDWSYPVWAPSRCGGICDDNRAICWCDRGKYAAQLPDPGGDPLAPYPKLGRPIIECQPRSFANGSDTKWAGPEGMSYDELWGEAGWCTADEPAAKCACRVDGLIGLYCNVTVEQVCANQCTGHGSCHSGYCRCYDGWYGHDCSLKRAGMELEPGDEASSKPYLANQVVTPLAAQPRAPRGATRKRPLIYIYDLPPIYNARLLQYRNDKNLCAWRSYSATNATITADLAYAIEPYLHEALLQSPHRTFDPEEADFFYAPVYTSCMIYPIAGRNPKPAFPVTGGQRVMHASMMLLEAKRWMQHTFPYWNRTGGKDHIFLLSHDEGACWAPKEIMGSTILTHWGRMDANNTSETGYKPDDFNADFQHPHKLPRGWLQHVRWHTCFDPRRHLAIPVYKRPHHYSSSPLLGAAPLRRDILMFFRGDVGIHHGDGKRYSRGIRQQVYRHYKRDGWEKKYHVLLSYRGEHKGSYSEFLRRALYCLAPMGDGFHTRVEDAILHGCIPVIIMDNVQAVLESVLDYSAFSVRIAQQDIPQLPRILLAIGEQRVLSMQRALSQVWHRFSYRAHKEEQLLLEAFQQQNLQAAAKQRAKQQAGGDGGGGAGRSQLQPAAFAANLAEADDALATLMQWLHSRIPYVKGRRQEVSEPLPGPQPTPHCVGAGRSCDAAAAS